MSWTGDCALDSWLKLIAFHLLCMGVKFGLYAVLNVRKYSLAVGLKVSPHYCFWHYPHGIQSRMYEMVEHPSVSPIDWKQQQHAVGLLLSVVRAQDIAARLLAAKAGSVVLTAEGWGWTQTCIAKHCQCCTWLIKVISFWKVWQFLTTHQ